MKSKMFLLMFGASLILVISQHGLVTAKAGQTSSVWVSPIKGEIRYGDYNTDDLVEVVALLSKSYRKVEAVEACEEALSRNLTPTQDAFVRYKMAQCYEYLPNSGPLAKEKYGEVLELHPYYERNIEVALRLGQLNDSTILPGTERNPARAVECYKHVVDHYSDPNNETVFIEVMQAHMHLGDIYAQLRDYNNSNKHYEAIYNCDPNTVEQLTYNNFDSPENLDNHKSWLKSWIALLKTATKKHLVGNCIRSDPDESVVELGKTIEKYADNHEIVEHANIALRQVWEGIAELDQVLKDAIEDPNGSVSEEEL